MFSENVLSIENKFYYSNHFPPKTRTDLETWNCYIIAGRSQAIYLVID